MRLGMRLPPWSSPTFWSLVARIWLFIGLIRSVVEFSRRVTSCDGSMLTGRLIGQSCEMSMIKPWLLLIYFSGFALTLLQIHHPEVCHPQTPTNGHSLLLSLLKKQFRHKAYKIFANIKSLQLSTLNGNKLYSNGLRIPWYHRYCCVLESDGSLQWWCCRSVPLRKVGGCGVQYIINPFHAIGSCITWVATF